METFADITNGLIPRGKTGKLTISLAELSRNADIEYSYFHGLMQGHRRYVINGEPVDKPLRPSVEKGLQTLDALERLGIRISPTDRERMITACLDVPCGFKLVATSDHGRGGSSTEERRDREPQLEDYDLLSASGWEQMPHEEKQMFAEIIKAWTARKSQQMAEHKHTEESNQQQECTA